jgi:hypothetical protein
VNAPDPAKPPRRLFLIEARAADDGLLRILEPFAFCQARLAAVAYDGPAHGGAASPATARVRVEAEGLTDDRAETLRHRLAKLPLVTAVAVGWQA